MANVKKGTLTQPPEWWKHLRWTKRYFWKAERKAHKKEIDEQKELGVTYGAAHTGAEDRDKGRQDT